MAARLIPIGELARRTGVAVTALRYYDELGLVRPTSRASGQRRYAESAIGRVGVVLLLRDASPEELEEAKTKDKAGNDDKDSKEAKDKDKEEKTPKPIVIDRYRFKSDTIGYLDRRSTDYCA